ncbi:uncharacterized protein PG986_011309 [Apiospora aurea]|uniref:Uncharacterized protein n=1 Tax=Apiospora aurea TaxID=335848 RepID=A0ABR1Q612_9PEZI
MVSTSIKTGTVVDTATPALPGASTFTIQPTGIFSEGKPTPTSRGDAFLEPTSINAVPSIPAEGGQTPVQNLTPASSDNVIPDHPVPTTILSSGHATVGGGTGRNGESLFVLSGSAKTITVPAALSTPVIVTTLGETRTFSAPPWATTEGRDTPPAGPVTTTLPNGHAAMANKGPNGESLFVLEGGSNTVTLPAAVTTPVTLTTMGETFTYSPLSLSEPGRYGTTTLSNGHVAVGSKGPNGDSLIILDGSRTITVPTGFSTSLILTTLGETFTISPPSTTSPQGDIATTTAKMGSNTPSGVHSDQDSRIKGSSNPNNQPTSNVKTGPADAGATDTAAATSAQSAACRSHLAMAGTRSMMGLVAVLTYQSVMSWV